MSRNYSGIKPLKGLADPVRCEAEAWRDIVNWRHRRGVPLSDTERRQAHRALASDPDVSLEMKASVTPLP